MAWLRNVREKGVVNMEMESLGFIALCHRAEVRGKSSTLLVGDNTYEAIHLLC